MEKADKTQFLWNLKTAVKQGYLIKFHRGLMKLPKMQYFVLMPTGLTWFNYRPDEDSSPVGIMPLKHLTSIKLDDIELNNCLLSCMEIISRTASTYLLAFSRKEERNEWMMAIMTAFAEALVAAKSESSVQKSKPKLGEGVVAAAVTQIHGIVTHLGQGQEAQKCRKRNRQSSMRISKSNDSLAHSDCGKNLENELVDEIEVDPVVSYEPSRKRKSEPDIYQVPSDFSTMWSSKGEESRDMKVFRRSCFDHRDSFDLIASRQCSKCTDGKSNIITKIISKFEQSTRLMHLKS